MMMMMMMKGKTNSRSEVQQWSLTIQFSAIPFWGEGVHTSGQRIQLAVSMPYRQSWQEKEEIKDNKRWTLSECLIHDSLWFFFLSLLKTYQLLYQMNFKKTLIYRSSNKTFKLILLSILWSSPITNDIQYSIFKYEIKSKTGTVD